MGKRQRKWARRAYEKLILQLGGRCVVCGSLHSLSIDHKDGKDWTACKVEWSHRISIYRREARNGLLQVLCVKCNSRKGAPQLPVFNDTDDGQYSLFTPDNDFVGDADESLLPGKPYEWTPTENEPF